MDEVGMPMKEFNPPLHPVEGVIGVPQGTIVVAQVGPQAAIYAGTCGLEVGGSKSALVQYPVKLLTGIGHLVALNAYNETAQRGPIHLQHLFGGSCVFGMERLGAVEVGQTHWVCTEHAIGGHPSPEAHQVAYLEYKPTTLFPGHAFIVRFHDVCIGDHLYIDWMIVIPNATVPGGSSRDKVLRPQFGFSKRPIPAQ